VTLQINDDHSIATGMGRLKGLEARACLRSLRRRVGFELGPSCRCERSGRRQAKSRRFAGTAKPSSNRRGLLAAVNLEARVGFEPLGGLILRKLLILRNSKTEKNDENAEVRYTAGTGNDQKTRVQRHGT